MILDDITACRSALAECLQNNGPVCFFTGAGVSTDSGIPDFRSPGGIWSQYRIIEYKDFLESEAARLEDWQRRFHMADLFEQSQPNAAHNFIAAMINLGQSNGVITQNIDGLHQRAGVPDAMVVEFHGTGAYAHCVSCRTRYEIADMKKRLDGEGKSPTCSCGAPIKAAVVSFGESIPNDFTDRAIRMIDSAETVVAMGSSLQVWPAAGLLERAKSRGALLCIINRDETPFDRMSDLVLHANIAEVTDNLQELIV